MTIRTVEDGCRVSRVGFRLGVGLSGGAGDGRLYGSSLVSLLVFCWKVLSEICSVPQDWLHLSEYREHPKQMHPKR